MTPLAAFAISFLTGVANPAEQIEPSEASRMKLRIHGVAVLLATLAPAALFAQAPAGVARVDTETYFDTSFSNTEFSGGDYNIEAGSSSGFTDVGDDSVRNAGLLGKNYARAGFIIQNVSDDDLSAVDNSLTGFDVELNATIPWLTSSDIGVDIFGSYEQVRFSGSDPSVGVNMSVDQDYATIGTRVFGFRQTRFRPYVALGVTLAEIDGRATGPGGTITIDQDDTAFVVNLGFEADIATNAAFRADLEVGRDVDIEEPKFEALLIAWPTKHIFLRGGLLIPLGSDDLGVGGIFGGGLAF